MLSSEIDASGCDSRIVLQPNCSASWPQARRLIVALGGFTLAVATAWSLTGLWLVIPFAGLEVALLAYLVYRVSQAVHQRQVLTANHRYIVLEQGQQYPKQRWQFARSQSYFLAIRPAHEFDGHRIFLCHGHSRIELGHFLNKSDKGGLLKALRALKVRLQELDDFPEVALKL